MTIAIYQIRADEEQVSWAASPQWKGISLRSTDRTVGELNVGNDSLQAEATVALLDVLHFDEPRVEEKVGNVASTLVRMGVDQVADVLHRVATFNFPGNGHIEAVAGKYVHHGLCFLSPFLLG